MVISKENSREAEVEIIVMRGRRVVGGALRALVSGRKSNIQCAPSLCDGVLVLPLIRVR